VSSSPPSSSTPAAAPNREPDPRELPKAYVPGEHEPRIRQRWDASGAFHADPERVLSGETKPYAIFIPPPNVTAALHLGHALNNTLQDILIRAHRMMGFEALWMPGTDHAGIATQAVVEKRLRKEGKLKGALRDAMKREEFVAHVQAFKDEYEATITAQLKAMGCSCDWPRQRFTMDEQCARAVYEAFFRLFKDGLIYRGKRLVNWDPILQTAVADDECYDAEIDGQFYYLRYPLTEPATLPDGTRIDHITVATTRPETYLGDTAVAMNPKDPRAKALVGKELILPLVGRRIRIIADDYVVLPESLATTDEEKNDPKAKMATGFLKVTPAHDQNDYDIGQRHQLAIINIFAPDATISDKHGWSDTGEASIFVGKKREEARKLVIEELKSRGLFEGSKPHRHSVKHSDRSKAIVEPYLSDQWYVKVTDPRLAASANAALVPEQRTGGADRGFGGSGSGGSPSGGTGLQTGADRGLGGIAPGGTGLQTGASSSAEHLFDRSILDHLRQRAIRPQAFVARDPYPPGQPSPDFIRTIRHLPHIEMQVATYFVTWTLRKGTLSPAERDLVLEAMTYWDGKTSDVYIACVMPDHVHAIVRPIGETTLGEWVSSVKKRTARAINEARGAQGPIWQDERFDHIVRDGEWLGAFTRYIAENPVKDGLVARASEYQWTWMNRPMVAAWEEGTANGYIRFADRTGLETGATKAADGDGSLRFYPARYAKTYEQWHDHIRDWCISRQLWWGHRIPVWRGRLADYAADSLDFSKFQYVAGELQITGNDDVAKNLSDFALVLHHAVECGKIAVRSVDGREVVATTSDDPTQPISFLLENEACICINNEGLGIAGLLEQFGFTRDPDVLDTWFSSALWPLSTLGWPDPAAFPGNTGLLEAFNPSSALCTAREIITLWVSRMVMFNRYFRDAEAKTHRDEVRSSASAPAAGSALPTSSLGNSVSPSLSSGPIPFHDVFIHALIMDGDGRKMSKTLGNGVDPLDIIASHGSDAMRFTLCQMTTQTQDVRLPVTRDPASGKNTSPKFDLGRNLCNKLWNAARYAMGILQSSDAVGSSLATPHAHARASSPSTESLRHSVTPSLPLRHSVPSSLSLPDRWLLSRLAAAVANANDSLKNYQFSEYAQGLYDLLWRDFCDWYLEAIKPTIAADANQRAVLANALHAILRLLHPIAPFVTEAIWERLRDIPIAPIEGIDLTPARKDNLLCTAGWPIVSASWRDEPAEREFERLRTLITAIREVRSQHTVPPKRKIALHIPAKLHAELTPHATLLVTLAGLSGIHAISTVAPDASVAFSFESQECRLSDLADASAIDSGAERARLEKSIADADKTIKTLEGRLANPGYADKAPPAMVQQTKDQLARAIVDRDAARVALGKLS